jgi:hypothetical protein
MQQEENKENTGLATTNVADIETITEVPSETIYITDRAQIDTQISTARKYPRNVTKAIANALAIVTLDIETAQTCIYSVPRGDKAITGPSIHLAKAIAQNWGNLRMEAKVVDIGERHITSEGICFDLETNIAIKTQVKRSIWGKKGRFSEDMITVTGNAANSIALRNAILSVIPKQVVDKIYNGAKKVITGDISDEMKLNARRKQVLDGFKDTYSLKEHEILAAIGKTATTHITAEDLVTLIGIGQALKDGDTTVEMAFRSKVATPPKTKEEEIDGRLLTLISACDTIEALNKLKKDCKTEKTKQAFEERQKALTK